MTHVHGLRCRECGREYQVAAIFTCEWCFGPLEVAYDYDAIAASISREKIAAGPLSLWRYADLLPKGPARVGAAATARSVAANLGPIELGRLAGAFAPSIEVVDHRILGTWAARGVEAALGHWRSWLELVEVTMRSDDILGLRPDALLVSAGFYGTERASGGAYDNGCLGLWAFGTDGLVTRVEVFDAGHEMEALARFDELTAAPRVVRFENAATRWADHFRDAVEAHDWERTVASLAPGYRTTDRRRMARIELDRSEELESLRLLFEMRSVRATDRLLATRGDRLALVWMHLEVEGFEGVGGPSELEFVNVLEVDDHGDGVGRVMFDPDDLDAAHAELDARYARGEAAPYARTWENLVRPLRAAAARSWEQLASAFAPDLVIEDHRPVGVLTLRSRDAYVASVRALLDLRPDARLRVVHVLALDDRRSLIVLRWEGGGSGRDVRDSLRRRDRVRPGGDQTERPLRSRPARRRLGALRGTAPGTAVLFTNVGGPLSA